MVRQSGTGGSVREGRKAGGRGEGENRERRDGWTGHQNTADVFRPDQSLEKQENCIITKNEARVVLQQNSYKIAS